MEDSFIWYWEFLTTNQRYRSAFNHRNNPREFLRKIHQAWYATDPNYVAKIESIWAKMWISV
jgi:flagellum-specific peptidoglycan hydrolase FlgJ